jgi:excisionase family DNA binding protein
MTDKLITLKEAAEALGVSENEVRSLVDKGEIVAYQVAGVFLRFKQEQIDILKEKFSKTGPSNNAALNPEAELPLSRLKDFLYFNDFYIYSGILTLILLYIILNSIR